MTQPDINAIICTRNRCTALAKALTAMLALKLPNTSFSLTVVDNASSNQTKETVNQFRSFAPFPVYYHFEPRIGLSHARNCGLKHAIGQVLAFTDDDCYVHED